MAARDKGHDPEQACPCSRLREGKTLTEYTNPGDLAKESPGAFVVRAGYTQHPRRSFCVCRACGSRWTVSEELDVKESETLYHWQEQPWTEKDLLLELQLEDGAMRQLAERQAQRLVAQAEATEKDAPLKQTRIEQTERLEWRWTDERGVACGCRIEGPRLAVWTEDPFGGTGTDYSIREFLDGRHAVLPLAVSGQVRQALATRHEE